MRLITQVTSLDTSSMLLKCFPRSGFFNFGNKSKSGGLSINNEGVQTGIRDLPKRWTDVIKQKENYIEGLKMYYKKKKKILKRKHSVCRISEMTRLRFK
jgi:hypothetical protein